MKARYIILFSILFFWGTSGLLAQDYQKIKQIRSELQTIPNNDTALINRYILLANEYRGKNKDSALLWINKAVKICLDKKYETKYDDVLYVKATIYYFSGDYKTSKNLQMQSLKQAKKNNNKYVLSKNYNLLGAIEFTGGNYPLSSKYYNLKLEISIELKDTSSIIETYYNIALIHQTIGDFDKAIQYNFKILKLAQTYKNDEAILLSSMGLAEVYTRTKKYAKAYEYVRIAKELAIKINDNYSLLTIYLSEGNILMEQKQAALAAEVFEKCIQLSKKYDDKYHLSVALNSKATALLKNNDFVSGFDQLKEAIEVNTQINRKQGIVSAYSLAAEAQVKMNNLSEALKYSRSALVSAKELGALQELQDIYSIMYAVYDKKQNSDSALKYFKLYSIYKDSIKRADQVNEMMRQELLFEKQKADQANFHQKQISDSTIQKQKQIKNVSIVFSALVLIVLIFLFRNYMAKKRANSEITKQKAVIERKNLDITDSINYSKRIQQAILTPENEVKAFLPDSFVYFRPKDIVSGDFYFIEPVITPTSNKWIAVALADCTGHGVPGAFMSIMSYNFLKQSLKQSQIHGPAQALDFVNKELHGFLRFESAQQTIRDGMDIAFCAFNTQTFELLYAGANNPIWLIVPTSHFKTITIERYKILNEWDDKIMLECLPNKQHIGFNEKINPFDLHTIQLVKGSQLYLFTDGYADQFGGPKHKKFKYSALQKIIREHSSLSMDEQMRILDKAFCEWKGEHEQVDDVSLIGIRV